MARGLVTPMDVDESIKCLVEAKTQMDGTPMGSVAAKSLIDEALEYLGYTTEEDMDG